MKRINILCLLSGALLTFAPFVNAQTSTTSVAPLSKQQKQQRKLARYDANGDGVLDKNEKAQMKTARAQRQQRRAARMQDPRKAAKHQQQLKRFDSNGDGKLDANERASARAYRQTHHHGKQHSLGPASSVPASPPASPPPSPAAH